MVDPPQARLLLASDLRAAIGTSTITLHYQPFFHLRPWRLAGFEALLRWTHPTLGEVEPGEAIPFAEQAGLMDTLTEWVLREACAEAAGWPDTLRVAVNVSASQVMQGGLAQMVAEALELGGLAPGRLELEVTESVMMADADTATRQLRTLREAGVGIAIDDFGTGYSSLSYLADLPISKIKLDRRFVARLGQAPIHGALIRSINGLCAELGLVCIAEGVETPAQLALLARENCGGVQGFLVGRPSSAAALHDALPGLVNDRAPMALEAMTSTAAAGDGIAFEQIVQTANDIVIVTDARLDPPGPTILFVNPSFTRLTGYTEAEAIGRSPRMLQGPGTSRAALDGIRAALRDGREVQQKVLNYAKCGAPYWLDLRIVPMRDPAGRIDRFVAIQRDVTLDKRRLDELEYVADRDILTGIPNRRALLRSLQAELTGAQLRHERGPSLAFIDVDHFKRVNDALGHAVGDAILFEVADRLSANIRRVDTVGRVGGEEFAVCLPALPLGNAVAIGQRLREAIAREPFDTVAGPVSVTVSVGVTAAAGVGETVADLMRRADRAMYRAKQSGRDRVAACPDLVANEG